LGKVVEAYSAAPDARQAFPRLAAELKKTWARDQMRRLLAAHARNHIDDPMLHLYRGELYIMEGQYRQAEDSFKAALKRGAAAAVLAPVRASRVLVRFHTGGAISAHADIGPREATFVQLVNLCLSDQNHEQLEALLDAHARTDPDDPALPRHRYRLRLRQ